MTPERWGRLRAALEAALDAPPEARETALEQACAGDAGLLSEARSLLHAAADVHGFLDAASGTEATRAGPPVSASRLSPGDRLGPYEIVDLLGSGGMGEVYRARDPRLGREVAIKVLPEALQADPDRIRRFEQEARAASALNHPNILTVHDVGTYRGAPYITTELVRGRSLRQFLASGPLPAGEVVDLAVQLAAGLAKAHEAGIVHRDLKPENIMVSEDGFVKILDFGLAKLHQGSGTLATASTDTAAVVGTVGYAAPEQLRGEPVDFRADQFSLGTVLYEMATGRRAFARRSAVDTLAALLNEEPPPIGRLNPAAPEALEPIVRRCLAKQPDGRYGSTRDLLRDLEGLRGTAGDPGAPRGRRIARAGLLTALGLALIGGLAWSLRAWKPRTVAIPSAAMLMVLPFDNLTGDPSQEYVSDGITEELITQLGRIHPQRLRVIARTSAVACKAAHKGVPEVARELGVSYVLEGSVRRAGERLRVSAHLVDAKDQTEVWADTYERGLADILGMEDEVAQAVAGAVHPVVAPLPRASARARPPSAEVVDACLRGRYHWNKRSPEGLHQALKDFQEAVRLDPTYAAGHSGLADVYLTLYDYEMMPPAEAAARARDAAMAALARDPMLAEAHSSLAHAFLHDWDWAAAEKEFRRAIELDPSYVTAHHWYALCLTTLGRMDEAVAQMRTAVQLDPLSLRVNGDVGMALYAAGRYEEAIAQERRTLALDPGFRAAYFIRGMAYEQEGRLEDAIRDYEHGRELTPTNANVQAALGHAYALAGRRPEAQRIAADLERRAADGSSSPFYPVVVLVGLGDKEAALAWLEKAYRAHSGSVRYLKADVRLAPLRSDPRYQDLMRRVGLTP